MNDGGGLLPAAFFLEAGASRSESRAVHKVIAGSMAIELAV
jgi:hypothetical protein